MNDALGPGTFPAVRINMGHDVMAYFLFLAGGKFEVNVFGMFFQLIDHFPGNYAGEAKFILGLGKGDPTAPPCENSGIIGKKLLHFPAGVS